MTARKEMKEEDVLAEEVEWVMDVMTDRVVDLVWHRAYENAWWIFDEVYSEEATVKEARSKLAYPGGRYVRHSFMTRDAVVARALFEGLRQKILELNFYKA